MKAFLFTALVGMIIGAGVVQGAQRPTASASDGRIRYLDYRADDVALIDVRRGTVTRIVLSGDEKIEAAASGFAADCDKEPSEWCVRAQPGSHEIWIKPREGASDNNLEIKTDRRDYSFELHLLPDVKSVGHSSGLEEPMFRVVVRYPAPPPTPVVVASLPPPSQVVAERLKEDRPTLRNTRYSMQVARRSGDIAPSLVFDDGRFTYFRFADAREIPTIFYINPSGGEERVNFEMQGELAVVQRTARRFVLRLGACVVGIWNDAFDPDGVASTDGTTVPGVVRVLSKDASP